MIFDFSDFVDVLDEITERYRDKYENIKEEKRESDQEKRLYNLEKMVSRLATSVSNLCDVIISDCNDPNHEEDDYMNEEVIAEEIRDKYGFEAFSVSDRKGAALIIPLDKDFSIKRFVNNFYKK